MTFASVGSYRRLSGGCETAGLRGCGLRTDSYRGEGQVCRGEWSGGSGAQGGRGEPGFQVHLMDTGYHFGNS